MDSHCPYSFCHCWSRDDCFGSKRKSLFNNDMFFSDFHHLCGDELFSFREVDPREVTARMDSAIVKKVLSMDVPKKMVKKAIRKRLAENGEDFTSAEALLEAVFRDTEDAPKAALSDLGDLNQSDLASGDRENPDSMRLAEENRQLKEQRLCKICMDEEVCVAFIPCGHLVSCSTCAPALNQCPICRAKIRGTIRTYMS
ncbi:hypothetical protein BsWGS_12925 [Bradybaena similaris]